MKKLLYIIPALVLAACSTDNTEDVQPQNPQTGELSAIEAVIDGHTIVDDTRNSLVDKDGERFILWSEGDAIGLNGVTSGGNVQGILDDDSAGKKEAMFWYAKEFLEGGVAYAYYPFSANAKIVNGKLTTTLTSKQTYSTESVFAPNVTIMVGKPDANGSLKFVNSCSIIEIRLKGTQEINYLALRSIATPLAGSGTVTIDDAEPAFVLDGTNDKFEISLDLDGSIQLSATEPTSFYFVIPPGTYSDLQVVANANGEELVRSLTKAHTLKPRHILPTAAFAFEPLKVDECTPLNDGALSNCYLIPANVRGKHSFETKHVNGTAINGEPVTAALLWEDTPNTVGNVHFDKASGKILFTTNGSGNNGSALISLFDADMNILWSWHIWVSDAEDQVLGAAQDVTILDRNLGAKWAPKSAAEVAAMDGPKAATTAGFYYQWGRNTPLPGPATLDSYYATKNYSIQNKWGYEAKSFSANTAKMYINNKLGKEFKFENKFFDSTSHTIETAAASPMAMFHGTAKPYYHTWASDLLNVNVGGDENLWSKTSKGNQDPCPAGYRVAGFSELLHAYRDYQGTGSSYCGFSHYLVGSQKVLVGQNSGNDNFGGYHQSASTNNNFVWLPACGVRISYMTTSSGAVPDLSKRSEQGATYMCGFYGHDNAFTLTGGRFYLVGVPDVAWTVATQTSTNNFKHEGHCEKGVYVPTLYMTQSGNPYAYKSGSDSRCNAVADAVPVRCLKMK